MLFLITLSLLSSVAVYATNSTNSTNSTNPNIIRRLLTLDAWHGGSGGYFYVMESSKSSAYITKICVRDGDVIDEIQVWFNNGETSGPYGGPGGEYSCYQVSDGNCITSVNGREGGLIDSLQFFGSDGSRSLYWGSYGGDEFSEQGTGCLKSLYIRAGAFLDGLQFNWKGPLECPAGSKQIGVLNSDIAGCGIEGCDKRYQDNYETIEDCLAGCRSISNCKSFSWAPLNGDKNHPGKTVCTLYDSKEPNQQWAPQQIMCASAPLPRLPAEVTLHCDNIGTLEISYDHRETFTVVSTEDDWTIPIRASIHEASQDTVLRLTCEDQGVVGGFIATVKYD
eukprot:936610_1